jgi:CMP-N,N'-diacetyllegionaminic acid synthase
MKSWLMMAFELSGHRSDMKYLVVIPARGGSKGLPGKNIRLLAGKPLIAWSIEHAVDSGRIDCVHVSTDDPEIAVVARAYGADVPYTRPSELSQDMTPTEPVMTYALDWYESMGRTFDAVVLLQPTSPIRFPGTLSAALDAFELRGAESLLGVCENHHFFWRSSEDAVALYDYRNRPRRQDIRPEDRWFRENGSIYVTRTAAFRQYSNRLCEPIHMHVMREEEGWEIDSLADFVVADSLMKMSHQL